MLFHPIDLPVLYWGLSTIIYCRMHNSIVVSVCAINFFYVFIVPGPILRHLNDFGKIRLLLGENTRFCAGGGSVWVYRRRAMTDFQFFFCVEFNYI